MKRINIHQCRRAKFLLSSLSTLTNKVGSVESTHLNGLDVSKNPCKPSINAVMENDKNLVCHYEDKPDPFTKPFFLGGASSSHSQHNWRLVESKTAPATLNIGGDSYIQNTSK